MKGTIIYRSDSKETRQSKRSFKRKLKSKKRHLPKLKMIYGKKPNIPLKKAVVYRSDIEKFCKVNNIHKWGKKTQTSIRLADRMNLFDHPEKVLKTLLQLLFNAKYYQSYPTIQMDGRISFGALYLIDNMCWEISRKRKWGFHHKNMSIEDRAIFSKLRSFFSSSYDDENAYMLNEKVEINRSQNRLARQLYKEKSKEVTDMIKRAIREKQNPEFDLSHEAYQAISSTIGEHFDNIVQHVPEAEYGFLCGFYDKSLQEVHILIFNFGKTISESISHTQLPTPISEEINSVLEKHTTNNAFNIFSNTFTKENALTLLALQEGVSSRLTYDRTRGHGLMDYIEHCFNLNQGVKISLISGKTAIKIDNKYKISHKFFIDRERRMLALNSQNDIYQKPDKDYVRNLDISFPGVIIETRIPLTL